MNVNTESLDQSARRRGWKVAESYKGELDTTLS